VRPGHDVDVLLFEHRLEPRALVNVPRLMVRVEEAADQHVGFLGPAMVRSPMKAFEVRIGKHAGHVVTFAAHCEPRESR